MAAPVSWEKYHWPAAQFPGEKFIRRRSEGRAHPDPSLGCETFNMVKSTAANNANACRCVSSGIFFHEIAEVLQEFRLVCNSNQKEAGTIKGRKRPEVGEGQRQRTVKEGDLQPRTSARAGNIHAATGRWEFCRKVASLRLWSRGLCLLDTGASSLSRLHEENCHLQARLFFQHDWRLA